MRRIPASLLAYVAASSLYAAIVFVIVHATYGLELGRSGIRLPDAGALVGSIDAVGFVVWVGISLIAGTVLHRLSRSLEGLRGEGAQRESAMASVFALGQALSGSLELDEIAERFLTSARASLDPSVSAAVYVQDDAFGGYRRLREQRAGVGLLAAERYTTTELPTPIRTRVVDHRQALVLHDVALSDAWPSLRGALADAGPVRSFAAVPLVAHDRLVGIALFASDRPDALTADRLQLTTLVTQLVAASIRTALSLREAESRANREAVVNRVAQRARATLDAERVLRSTIDELARTLPVVRVLAVLGARPDALRAGYETVAEGVAPLGAAAGALEVARAAALAGRTTTRADGTSDIATPIVIGGELAGALALQADEAHDWSTDEVRLLEAVARELRVAMEAARLFEARQRENERLVALQRASAVLATRSTAREVIDEILHTAADLLGDGSAALYRWDEGGASLRLAQQVDPAGHPVSAVLPTGDGMSGDLLRKLEPVIVNDYPSWPGASENGLATGLRAVLGVPLLRGGRLVGALVVRSYQEETRFGADEARLLTLFGDQASAALANVEAFERQRAAVEELERVNRAKSEFVSIVSHEFRTPLTGIQGFSEMLRDERLTPEEVRDYATDINKDAQRLGRMINEMLDLSRMESGRMELRRETVDLDAIVAEVVDRVRPNAPEHRIALALEGGLPPLVGDRDRITQVVANLLSNAVKYSPTGGAIVIETRREAGAVHLLVRDSGIGIAPEALETIWERYQRVDSDATRGIQGSGLGLPIVRQIVALHGGRTWAESELGRGSVFHVTLPLAAGGRPVEA